MPKSPNVGPKPVDNGMLGNAPPAAPGIGWGSSNPGGGMSWGNTGGLGGASGPWGPTSGLQSPQPYGGAVTGGMGRIGEIGQGQPFGPSSGLGIPQPYSGPVTGGLGQIGSGGLGGLQGLLSSLRGGMGSGGGFNPGLGMAGNNPSLGGVGGPANPMAPPTFEGGGDGDAGFFNNPMGPYVAPRAGFQQGNRGAQKRMSGSAAPRTAADTNWEGPGSASAPPAPPPGITSDPGPAGGGLQGLLARARAMSPSMNPWARR
jgi:hypothetical protein